jgi:hypothetical protein
MKRFILMSVFILFSIIGNSQKKMSLQISPSFFIGNSVIVGDNTSFTNLKEEETHILNYSNNYGVNFNIFWRDRFSYYQSKLNGIKVGILSSNSFQSITYSTNISNSYTLKDMHQFIDIPVLFTQSSTNHQVFIFEVGPMFSYYINDNNWYFSAVGKMGINNHISKRLSYSILFSNYYTKLSKPQRFRLNNGLEFNLIYRVTKK